jgi:hypothetical protein
LPSDPAPTEDPAVAGAVQSTRTVVRVSADGNPVHTTEVVDGGRLAEEIAVAAAARGAHARTEGRVTATCTGADDIFYDAPSASGTVDVLCVDASVSGVLDLSTVPRGTTAGQTWSDAIVSGVAQASSVTFTTSPTATVSDCVGYAQSTTLQSMSGLRYLNTNASCPVVHCTQTGTRLCYCGRQSTPKYLENTGQCCNMSGSTPALPIGCTNLCAEINGDPPPYTGGWCVAGH